MVQFRHAGAREGHGRPLLTPHVAALSGDTEGARKRGWKFGEARE